MRPGRTIRLLASLGIPSLLVTTGCVTTSQLNTQVAVLQQAIQRSRDGLPPIGAVAPFAGALNQLPAGWALANGVALGRVQFPELFAVLGTHWGGDGTMNFNLPDLSGPFLRGVDSTAGRDPDAQNRRASNAGGSAGNTVGSVQDDALQTHRHAVAVDFHATGSNGTHDVDDNSKKFNSDPSFASLTVTVLDPTGARISTETRPVNANVYWVIRVK
jgi:microcystin-dependent protein